MLPAEKHKSKHQCADMSSQRRSRHPHGAFASILIFIQYFLRADGWFFSFFFWKKKQPRYPAAAGGWLFYLHWERARCSFECWTIGKLQLWFYKEGLSDMKLHHWCQRGIKHIILNITEAQASKKKVWPCSGKPLWRQKSENNSPQYNHQQ